MSVFDGSGQRDRLDLLHEGTLHEVVVVRALLVQIVLQLPLDIVQTIAIALLDLVDELVGPIAGGKVDLLVFDRPRFVHQPVRLITRPTYQ